MTLISCKLQPHNKYTNKWTDRWTTALLIPLIFWNVSTSTHYTLQYCYYSLVLSSILIPLCPLMFSPIQTSPPCFFTSFNVHSCSSVIPYIIIHSFMVSDVSSCSHLFHQVLSCSLYSTMCLAVSHVSVLLCCTLFLYVCLTPFLLRYTVSSLSRGHWNLSTMGCWRTRETVQHCQYAWHLPLHYGLLLFPHIAMFPHILIYSLTFLCFLIFPLFNVFFFLVLSFFPESSYIDPIFPLYTCVPWGFPRFLYVYVISSSLMFIHVPTHFSILNFFWFRVCWLGMIDISFYSYNVCHNSPKSV